jgi:hypothetical protein
MKETYNTPRLTTHGNVETITQAGGTGNYDFTPTGPTTGVVTASPTNTGNINITPAT